MNRCTPNKDMRNGTSSVALAMTTGVAIGMITSVFAQKAINQHHLKTCRSKANHTLIKSTEFLGDTYHCVHNRYL